jgi:hypothetical protein
MRAWVGGIAAEGTVAAVIAAEISQRQEDFARVGDCAGLEVFFCRSGRREQCGQVVLVATDQPQGQAARDWCSRSQSDRVRSTRITIFRAGRADGTQNHDRRFRSADASNHT